MCVLQRHNHQKCTTVPCYFNLVPDYKLPQLGEITVHWILNWNAKEVDSVPSISRGIFTFNNSPRIQSASHPFPIDFNQCIAADDSKRNGSLFIK
jgi:hypothetical protein